jgi:predicted ATPase
MLIADVYIRFYRSFNFDYLRKSDERSVHKPWDVTEDGLVYPFVKVSIEDGITAVVGANESGKSQLLSAIRCGLTGDDIRRGDFCRYSQFFSVSRNMSVPEFGLYLTNLSDRDVEQLEVICSTAFENRPSSFYLFRFTGAVARLYFRVGSDWSEFLIDNPSTLDPLLPRSFEIKADIPLPDSVPIDYLATGDMGPHVQDRSIRRNALDLLLNDEALSGSTQEQQQVATEVISLLTKVSSADGTLRKQLQLADALLVGIAGIDRSAFTELLDALRKGDEGYANGVIELINSEMMKALNFPRWWTQDRHFQLLVTLRDFDLVFTIKDRTGTEYSFSERSGGMKYFLSYFVQYLSHEYPDDGTHEILLMDEPDAYLSSRGQQDLLRVFDEFAFPTDDRPRCQVVYVTHSPYLIDKNHGERVRVLEKGEGDEGTRVVNNVSRNHYEPLRSAFGSFVGETTFIGNCNLMLEGLSDQILLAGMSSRLRNLRVPNTENLDLNTITLVPAGSASQIPYLAYLARGRDIDRPAVIVLLDSDQAGNDAKRSLEKSGPKNRQVLDPKLVLQLGMLTGKVSSDNPGGVKEIEDLIPFAVAWEAVLKYVEEFEGPTSAAKLRKKQMVADNLVWDEGTHSALEIAVQKELGSSAHLEKIGFARSVIQVMSQSTELEPMSVHTMDANFRAIFKELNMLQRKAERANSQEKNGSKLKRAISRFKQDHPEKATRDQAMLLVEELELALQDTPFVDEIRSQLRTLVRTHSLTVDLADHVEDLPLLKKHLDALTAVETLKSQSSAELAI